MIETSRWLDHLRKGQTGVADIRGCMNAGPNSISAAKYAVDEGFKSIYMSALYHDQDRGKRPEVMLTSPFVAEHKDIPHMSYHEWFTGPHRDSQCDLPEGVADLALVTGLEEVWIEFINPPEQMAQAWALGVPLVYTLLPKEIRACFCTDDINVSLPPPLYGANPDGRLGYSFLYKPSNMLEDMALMRNPGDIIKKTISFDGHPQAELSVIPIS